MKILVVFILFIIYSTSFSSAGPVYDSLVLEDEQQETFCAQKKCIRKCCQKNQYVNSNLSCEGFHQELDLDFSNISIYSERNREQKINKTIRDLFYLVPGRFEEKIKELNEASFKNIAYILSDYVKDIFLSESGALYVETRNYYERWNFAKYYCVDYFEKNFKITPTFWCIMSTDVTLEKIPDYYIAALLVSTFFLFLVLLVYILLPELRNLVGLVLMAYVFSLMGAFIFLVCMQLEEFEYNECIIMTAFTYFFFLATSCWMNVMSYDIWWTFRGYAKARKIHTRGEKIKFCVYCIYAWGVPLLMTVMLVVIDNMDLSHMPWFVKPQIAKAACFLSDGQKLLYLLIPMLLLILCNWFFFLMTAFNIWRLSRSTAAVNSDAAGNPAAHRSQRQRFMIYLKLSLVMGINWVLEVLSVFSPDLILWKITDMYNILVGLAIFLIFVCKKKIYKKLYDRYINKTKKLSKSHMSSSIQMSNISEASLQIFTQSSVPNKS